MRRREFISLVGGAAVTYWHPARAQQPAMPVIGLLSSTSPGEYVPFMAAFRQGLTEAGFVDGQNVAIEYRWAEDHYDRLPALTAQLVARPVAVIATMGGPPAALAANVATQTIPLVFVIGADPVKAGLVASLSRPRGNITGVTMIGGELFAKRLEVVRELVPSATEIAVLVNSGNPISMPDTRDMEKVASVLGRQVYVQSVSTDSDFDPAFATLAGRRTGALIVGNDGFLNGRRVQIVALASRYAVPTVYPWRTFVEAGGLISYGASLTDADRQAGAYTGRILKGEKPADLPVLRPTKFELVISLKTAKRLGLTIPPALLARADEVIE